MKLLFVNLMIYLKSLTIYDNDLLFDSYNPCVCVCEKESGASRIIVVYDDIHVTLEVAPCSYLCG